MPQPREHLAELLLDMRFHGAADSLRSRRPFSPDIEAVHAVLFNPRYDRQAKIRATRAQTFGRRCSGCRTGRLSRADQFLPQKRTHCANHDRRFGQFWVMRDGSHGKSGSAGNEGSATCAFQDPPAGSNPTLTARFNSLFFNILQAICASTLGW